jgi:hypothetical protein
MKKAPPEYFVILAGGAAGLLSWGIVTLLSFLLVTDPAQFDLMTKVMLGAVVGGSVPAFAGKYVRRRVSAQQIALGAVFGGLSGLLAGFAQVPIGNALAESAPIVGRLIAWMLLGSLMATAVALSRLIWEPTQIPRPFLFGLAGGLAGGIILSFAGSVPDVASAFAYSLFGAAIAAGYPLTDQLVTSGTIHFVNSSDGYTHTKFSKTQPVWAVGASESLVITGKASGTRERIELPETEFNIPDPLIAARHAIISTKDGRYFLTRHKEIRNEAGVARFILKLRDKTVLVQQELADGDDFLVGQTTLVIRISPIQEAK